MGHAPEPARVRRLSRPKRVPATRGRDGELEAGSQAPYRDAVYYTSLYKNRIDDVQFYVDLAVKNGGPVLELGIGNGRIALPVARHGVAVVGVDLSPVMLADLRERLREEPPEVRARVRLRRGDMRSVALRERFPLVICPFNAALHLYDRHEVERFFATVRRHLAPGGTFVADLSIPHPEDLARDPTRAHHSPRFRHPSTGEVVRYHEYFDYDRARQTLFVSAVFRPVKDPMREWTMPLTHRQFYPREWEALLHYNGFDVTRVDGDFIGGPLERDCDVMVWHARLRRGWRNR